MPDTARTASTSACPSTGMAARIICVDDEPNVLASLKLMLREYDVHTATSAAQGLELLKAFDPVPVVISDMRMPQVSGAQFLKEVAVRYPMTARVLLTGASDMEAAVDAVNLGNLFRFLLKPCPPEHLRATLGAALEHHRILTSERDLLQRTLVGSMHALTEVLGIADPVAFGRIGRLKELACAVARKLNLEELWPIEYAALVCQLGNISLPEATAKKLYANLEMTAQERVQIDAALRLAPEIIKHIPRLDPVRRILEDLAAARQGNFDKLDPGARVLRLILAYEAMERSNKHQMTVLKLLHERANEFDVATFNALLQVLGAAPLHIDGAVSVRIDRLRPGMVTADELRALTGVLIVPRGVVLTESLIARLANFADGYLPTVVSVCQ